MKLRRLNLFYGKDHVISTKPKMKRCPFCKGTMIVPKYDKDTNKCYETECNECDGGIVEV